MVSKPVNSGRSRGVFRAPGPGFYRFVGRLCPTPRLDTRGRAISSRVARKVLPPCYRSCKQLKSNARQKRCRVGAVLVLCEPKKKLERMLPENDPRRDPHGTRRTLLSTARTPDTLGHPRPLNFWWILVYPVNHGATRIEWAQVQLKLEMRTGQCHVVRRKALWGDTVSNIIAAGQEKGISRNTVC